MEPTIFSQEYCSKEIEKLEKELEKLKNPHQKVNAIKYYIAENDLIRYLPDEKVKPVIRFVEGRYDKKAMEKYPDLLARTTNDQRKSIDGYYKTFQRWYYGVIADFHRYNEWNDFDERKSMYDFFETLLNTIAKIELVEDIPSEDEILNEIVRRISNLTRYKEDPSEIRRSLNLAKDKGWISIPTALPLEIHGNSQQVRAFRAIIILSKWLGEEFITGEKNKRIEYTKMAQSIFNSNFTATQLRKAKSTLTQEDFDELD